MSALLSGEVWRGIREKIKRRKNAVKPPLPSSRRAKYFPIQQRWRKLKPIFESDKAHSIWWPNMLDYAVNRSIQNGYELNGRHLLNKLPRDFDSCDWRWGEGRRGPQPAFWNYVCHSACHWMVDCCLYVAMTAYPDIPWRIISSSKHSTVWNGDFKNPILFDVNFLALGVHASEAIHLACRGRVLKKGTYLRAPSRTIDFRCKFTQ